MVVVSGLLLTMLIVCCMRVLGMSFVRVELRCCILVVVVGGGVLVGELIMGICCVEVLVFVLLIVKCMGIVVVSLNSCVVSSGIIVLGG